MRVLIFLLAFFVAGPAWADDCATFWEQGIPDTPRRRTGALCEEFTPEATGALAPHSIFISQSIASDPAVRAQLEIIGSAMKQAIARYEDKAPVPLITLIRFDEPYFADANAFAFTFTEFFHGDETCPILVYPHSTTLDRSELEQVIAHEVFHCVQKWNFKEQVTAAVTDGHPGFWWFEGIAQYFSNVVFPNNDFEYSPRFPAPHPGQPFFDEPNPYSTENFWQAYANEVEQGVLFNAQEGMPRDGASPKAKAAADLPLVSDALHQYARDITRRKVRDESGRYAPYGADFITHAASSDPVQEITLTFKDFAVGAHQISLPAQRIWRLSIASAPDGTKAAIKKADEDDYYDFGAVFQTASRCDEDQLVQIVLTRVVDSPAQSEAVIRIDSEDNPECKCDNPAARRDAALPACVIGKWIVPMDVVQHPSKYSGSIDGATSALKEFDYELEIFPNKTYRETLTYENEARGPSVMKPGETVTMNQRFTAQSSGQVCPLTGDRLEFMGDQHIVQELSMAGYSGANSGGRNLGPSPNRTTRDYYCGEGASDVEPPMAYPVNIDYLKARGF